MSAGLIYQQGENSASFEVHRYPFAPAGSASPQLTVAIGVVDVHGNAQAEGEDNPYLTLTSAKSMRSVSSEFILDGSPAPCTCGPPIESNASTVAGCLGSLNNMANHGCGKMGLFNIAAGANEIDMTVSLHDAVLAPPASGEPIAPGTSQEICTLRFFTFNSTNGAFMPLPDNQNSVFYDHVVYLSADGDIYLVLKGCDLSTSFGSYSTGGINILSKAMCIKPVEGYYYKASYSNLVTRFGSDPMGYLNKASPKRVIQCMIRTSSPEFPYPWYTGIDTIEKCDKNYFQCYEIEEARTTPPSVGMEWDGDDSKVRWYSGKSDCASCGPEGGAKLAGIGAKSLIEHGFGECIRVLAATHFSTLEDGEITHVAWKRLVMAGETSLQVGAIPGGSTSTRSAMKTRFVPKNTTFFNTIDIEASLEITRSMSWTVYERWQQTIEVIGDYDFDKEAYKNVSINGLDLTMKKLFIEQAMSTSAHMSLGMTINENFKFGFDMTVTSSDGGPMKIVGAKAYMSMSQVFSAITGKHEHWKDNVNITFNLGGTMLGGAGDKLKNKDTGAPGSVADEIAANTGLFGTGALHVKSVACTYRLHIPNGLDMGGSMTYSFNAAITPDGINPKLNWTWQKTDALSFKADFDSSGLTALGVNYNPVLLGTSKKDRLLGATVQELRMSSGLVWKTNKGGTEQKMVPNMIMTYNYGNMVTVDADLLTGQASIQLKAEIYKVAKSDAQGNVNYSASISAYLNADSDLSDDLFTVGVDFKMEKALVSSNGVFGRVVLFVEGGVNIRVGGGQESTAITSVGFRFFAGVKVGIKWKNTIFEYLGFPFNVNFAPSFGFAIDLNWGVCSSYGTCAGFSAGYAFAVNMGIAAFEFEWVDGLRAELTRKHRSVFRYIPFIGPILAKLPIISVLGPKEDIAQYIKRAGPHRALNVFKGCTTEWENGLVAYRKSSIYNSMSKPLKKQAIKDWHLANPFCQIVTNCFDAKRIHGHENSWVQAYFDVDCGQTGCKGDKPISHYWMMQEFSTSEQFIYDTLIVGDTPKLETSGLMAIVKKWTGWNMLKAWLKRVVFGDPDVQGCDIKEGEGSGEANEECFVAYARYVDFVNGFTANATSWECGPCQDPPESGCGGCNPVSGPWGRPWQNAKVTDFIGRTALQELIANMKDSSVGKDHTLFRTWKHQGVECKFCIQKIWHMYLQSMRCANNPDVNKAKGLFHPMFSGMVGTASKPGSCKDTPIYDEMVTQRYQFPVDKAWVYGIRSATRDFKTYTQNIIANPILRSYVWSTNSTWQMVQPGNNAIILDVDNSINDNLASRWGMTAQQGHSVPMYANMAEIYDDLRYLMCSSWSSMSNDDDIAKQDLGYAKLYARYWMARRAVTYIKVLADQGSAIGLDDIQSKALGEALAWAHTGMVYLRHAMRMKYLQIDPSCDSSWSREERSVQSINAGRTGLIVRDKDGCTGLVGTQRSGDAQACYQAHYNDAAWLNLPAIASGKVQYQHYNAMVLARGFGNIPLSFIFYGKFEGDSSVSDASLFCRLTSTNKTMDPAWTVSEENSRIKAAWHKECNVLTGTKPKSRKCKKYRKDGNRVPDKNLEGREKTTCFPHGSSNNPNMPGGGGEAQWMLGMKGCCDEDQRGWINFWCNNSSTSYGSSRGGKCGWSSCEWKDMNTTGWPNPANSPAWGNNVYEPPNCGT